MRLSDLPENEPEPTERELELRAELDELRTVFKLRQEGREEAERLAEIRGAAWACEWYWASGLRHHGANPAQICAEARERPRK